MQDDLVYPVTAAGREDQGKMDFQVETVTPDLQV